MKIKKIRKSSKLLELKKKQETKKTDEIQGFGNSVRLVHRDWGKLK